MSACELMERPASIARASAVEWGVIVDAYLTEAARVGDRYAALVYDDLDARCKTDCPTHDKDHQ
ncbi:hypothetical protein [Pseudomonas syringae]|uniref:hypothetical protein n=1 Tax=Pseudomonas syringae TaxID=317 RepID=UPI000ADD0907|nr:hypothetical protein [Pseudomonas syringae]